MIRDHIEQQLFSKEDYREVPLPKGDYENCNFRDCNFAASDLSGIRFMD
jgi:fluoroquinolone resistance protein